MKNSKIQQQKISSYLFGEMTTPQKMAFEEEIKTNSELQNEVALAKDVNNTLKTELLVADFNKKIAKIHKKNFDKPKTKIINLQNKWYWAAASITLFSGTATYSIKNKLNQPEYLYKQYYSVWQPALATRSVDNSLEKQILNHFQNANYDKALELTSELPKTELTPQLVLTKGCSLMEIGKYEEAITEFKSFETNNYTLYTEAGNWYKALCFLKLNDIENASLALNEIINYESTYSADAKKLLKKIK